MSLITNRHEILDIYADAARKGWSAAIGIGPSSCRERRSFGAVTYTALPNRQIQFGLRLAF